MNIDSPKTYKIEHIILLASIIVLFLIEARLREDFKKGIDFSDKTKKLIARNICPLCEVNRTSKTKIKVGYTIDKSYISYKIWRITNNYQQDEISGSVPICERCREEFLAYRIADPSKLVLEGKPGFHRGLFNPYNKENVFDEE